MPTALFLTITDSQKVGRKLRFVSPSSTTGPVIRLTGKVDDYVVQLGPGATHTRFSTSATIGPWRRSNSPSSSQQERTGWSPVSLAAEHRYSKGDMALLKFWMGTAQSNELTFYVPIRTREMLRSLTRAVRDGHRRRLGQPVNAAVGTR